MLTGIEGVQRRPSGGLKAHKAEGYKRHVGFPSFSEVALGLSCLPFCTHCRLSAPLQSISHFRSGLGQNWEPLLSARQQLYSVSCCLATWRLRGLTNRLTRTIAASLPQLSQWASMTSAGTGKKEGQRDTGMVALWCGWHPVSPALSLFLSLITAHMTRECDRTNVSESKESVSLAARWRWSLA